MDVFAEYKPIRNRIANLSIEEALATIWSYGQYLQIRGFRFPREVDVSEQFLNLDVPRLTISEWDLELLAREVIVNGNLVARKGRRLRDWRTMIGLVGEMRAFENDIYGAYGSPGSVLVEMIRIAHRQFAWQANPPNSAAIIRHYKIFNRPAIDEICKRQIGLGIWEIYMCATACMGFFLEKPAVAIPFKVEIKALSVEAIERFFAFTSRPLPQLKTTLKSEQRFDSDFAYAYNSLRAYPLVRMTYQGGDAIVCPMMTLLYWRFTSGLYYELIKVPEFANELGEGFQNYVGDVIDRACPPPLEKLPEETYSIGRAQKRSVDWIVADGDAALFVECKAKRLSWNAKSSLDTGPLEKDIASIADAVVQVYKTLADHLAGAYPHFPVRENRKLFPAVVTLENWRMFGPVAVKILADAVAAKLANAGLPADLIEQAPYSIWSIEDFEVGLQIMAKEGLAPFMDGKLRDEEMRASDWHGYMVGRYRKHYPLRKLFEAEYDEIFAPLYKAQQTVE